MAIFSKMRKQNAIYWPPATKADDFGRPTFDALVELVLTDDGNYRVRWEDRNEEFLDAVGSTKTSNAVVYVPALPEGGELVVGGYLWLGERASLTNETVPTLNDGAYEIMRVDKMPNLKNTKYLRTAYL